MNDHRLCHREIEKLRAENAKLKETMAEMDTERRNAWDYAHKLETDNAELRQDVKTLGDTIILYQNDIKELKARWVKLKMWFTEQRSKREHMDALDCDDCMIPELTLKKMQSLESGKVKG